MNFYFFRTGLASFFAVFCLLGIAVDAAQAPIELEVALAIKPEISKLLKLTKKLISYRGTQYMGERPVGELGFTLQKFLNFPHPGINTEQALRIAKVARLVFLDDLFEKRRRVYPKETELAMTLFMKNFLKMLTNYTNFAANSAMIEVYDNEREKIMQAVKADPHARGSIDVIEEMNRLAELENMYRLYFDTNDLTWHINREGLPSTLLDVMVDKAITELEELLKDNLFNERALAGLGFFPSKPQPNITIYDQVVKAESDLIKKRDSLYPNNLTAKGLAQLLE